MRMFFAMGKKKKSYIYDEDEIREEKVITIGFVGDERICDGFYYASSFKSLNRILAHPEVLETNLDAIVEDQK
jgi:pyruvate/2-oxoglutarate dehydrogenase complex dihydrolipoamide acyltransferase (E2) component